jgi:hypothetical protein
LFFSPGLIGSNHITIIEDGLSNYLATQKDEYTKFRFFLNLLGGPLMGYDKFGNNPYCDRIILTGLNRKRGMKDDKRIQWIDIRELWLRSSLEKQEKILSIFSVTPEDIDILKGKDAILFTQCFSEDHWMTEKEKISMYEGIVKNIKSGKLVIKPHPRETTDYRIYFPDACVFVKKVPIQLLELIGVRFKTSYTIASTAALSFSYELENIFLGSSYHPKVFNGYEKKEIKLSDFQ